MPIPIYNKYYVLSPTGLCAKCFKYINSFNTHNNIIWQMLLLTCLFYRGENQSPDIKYLAPGHITSKGQSQDSNPGPIALESVFPATMPQGISRT